MAATTLEEFLAFMEEPNVVDGDTLYIAVRAFARLAQGEGFYNSLMVAVAIVPGTIEGAVPQRWRLEPLTQIARLCTLNECEKEPEDPVLRAAWLKIEDSRAAHRTWQEKQDRAERLLVSQLNESQLAEFKKRHRFRVQDDDGYTYLITYEAHGNVWRVVEDGAKTRKLVNYCIVPETEIPIYDQMLAQKLLIENDLETFKSIANATVIQYDENDKPFIDEPGQAA